MPAKLLTFKLRLRDKHSVELSRQAHAVNFVWNYCNETQRKAAQEQRPWLSGPDLQRLTAGSSIELGLHSHTIKRICQQYVVSRIRHKLPWLRFRGRKSLGWVPFSQSHVTVVGPGKLKFRGSIYETMNWREIPAEAVIHAGSFNADARGRWYINVPVAVPPVSVVRPDAEPVGIDLGLKDLAVLSTGAAIENPQHYRVLEQKYGKARRACKKRLARAVAAKISDCRKDHLHKASTRIALGHSLIAVGNVSSKNLARTKMAKSVLDAGWSSFRRMLEYKAIRHGSRYIEVNECFTTQTCSTCGSLPEGRPRGIAGLGIREWVCTDCGSVHDRDVNAARNILRLGLETLAEGAPA